MNSLQTLDLQCFSRCPKLTGATKSDSDENWAYQANPSNKEEWEIKVSDGASTTFKFKATTKNLYDGSGSTAFTAPTASGSDQGGEGGAWVQSGVLVTAAQLASITDQNISPWELEGKMKEYYSWESSSEIHGQYYGLMKADGSYETFDKPIEFQYTHATANDYDGSDASDGKYVRLEYAGRGELWGIPWKKAEGASEDSPIFSIKSGTTITDGSGASYKLKALEVAQRPSKVDGGQCASLSLDNVPALPTSEDMIKFELAAEPNEEDSPIRVEKGEVL